MIQRISSDITQDNRLLAVVNSPLPQDTILLQELQGDDMVSAPFWFRLSLLSSLGQESEVTTEALIGKSAAIRIALSDDFEAGPQRYIHGVIRSLTQRGQGSRFAHFEAELVPWLWLLTLRSDCRIFQNQTIPEIVEFIFGQLRKDVGGVVAFENRLHDQYTKLDYCVQYRETDFHFISRLLEQAGIYYFFEHKEDSHTLVMADSWVAQERQPAPSRLVYHTEGYESENTPDGLTTWMTQQKLSSGQYTLRDFNPQVPDKSLQAGCPTMLPMANNHLHELYDYPGEYAQWFNLPDTRLDQIETEAQRMATLRMQEEESGHYDYRGESNARNLASGFRFQLSGHFDPNQNRAYLLTSVHHHAIQTPDYVTNQKASGGDYRTGFTAVPHDIAYRPRRTTSKPLIQGIQTARVIGPPHGDEEIWTDKYGRVKVRFHWDREAGSDDHPSCWIRVGQSWASGRFGAHFWPRVGDEVIVAFLNGDPDAPLIVGSTYNGVNGPPYDLPQHQTRSGIKTRSTPNGSDDEFNELRFEDEKGREQIRIHAQRDLDTTVLHNETAIIHGAQSEVVKQQQSLDVHGGREVNVEGDLASFPIPVTDALTVDGTRHATVNEDDILDVRGDRRVHSDGALELSSFKEIRLTVGGSKITVGPSSIELQVGPNSLKIDPLGIWIDGLNASVQSKLQTTIHGAVTNVSSVASTTINGTVTYVFASGSVALKGAIGGAVY